MNKAIAKFISLIFHPIFQPIFGVLAIVNLHMVVAYKLNAQPKALWLFMFFLVLSLLPLLGVMLLLNKFTVKSLSAIGQQERRIAAWVLCLVYAVEFWMFSDFLFHPILKLFVLALCFSSGVLAIVSPWRKISFHVYGATGLTVLMGYLALLNGSNYVYLLVLSVLATGVIATARLALKAHSRQEVYLGFIISLICNIAVYLIFNGRL